MTHRKGEQGIVFKRKHKHFFFFTSRRLECVLGNGKGGEYTVFCVKIHFQDV